MDVIPVGGGQPNPPFRMKIDLTLVAFTDEIDRPGCSSVDDVREMNFVEEIAGYILVTSFIRL